MKHQIKAVIFDWAGTTVDYGSFAPVQAFISAFEEYGITPTAEEVRKPMGMLKRDHIRTMLNMDRIRKEWKQIHGKDFTENDVEQVYLTSEKNILDILKNFAKPKPWVLQTAAALREQGIRIGSTTGYIDEMMEVVVPAAKAQGYQPDCWYSPNAVDNIGRPWPYMIFENLKKLRIPSVAEAIKVGDTVADIQEGLNAGMISVGVIEGSSVMGLSQAEYEALSQVGKEAACRKARNVFEAVHATCVLQNMQELPQLIRQLQEGQ